MSVARKPVRDEKVETDAHLRIVPDEKPQRAYAGRGSGARCDLCHEPIEADQIEYEIELEPHVGIQAVSLHLECYEEWILLGPSRASSRKPDQRIR